MTAMHQRQERGKSSYRDGLSAEDGVLATYLADGHEVAARRWRGKSGEIDLIFRKGAEVIFVEVKKARTLARAAERLSMPQLARIFDAATEFLSSEPEGTLTQARVDFAMVDGAGRQDIMRNVML